MIWTQCEREMGENFARQNNLNMKGGFYGVRETAWGHLRENRDPQLGEIISEGASYCIFIKVGD